MTETASMEPAINTLAIITAAPVRGDDPRVYTDPYPGVRGADRVKEICGKCGGDGIYHAPSGLVIQNPYGRRGDTIKGCFDCMGLGYRIVKVSSIRARIRRAVSATLARDADAEAYAAQAAQRAAEEFGSAWDEAHAEQERRAALNNEPAGQPGERIRNVAGTVEVSMSIEVAGFRGYGTDVKRLVVVKLDSGQVIKTFGTARALFGTRRGDSVTITGATIKEIATYQGQVQTVVSRAVIRIDVPVLRSEDVGPGDTVETGGAWYPVTDVDERGVTVGLETATARTCVLRYRDITGHRARDAAGQA
jgi:hypothetical protein